MDGDGKALKFADVLEINRRMIQTFGGIFFEGDDNLGNPGSLEYILEAVQGSLFGYDPYPTLVEKAAALAWRIIAGHVFHDGNKRTGMEACRLLLDLNGYVMRIDAKVVDVAVRIASGKMEFTDLVQWLEVRVAPRG